MRVVRWRLCSLSLACSCSMPVTISDRKYKKLTEAIVSNWWQSFVFCVNAQNQMVWALELWYLYFVLSFERPDGCSTCVNCTTESYGLALLVHPLWWLTFLRDFDADSFIPESQNICFGIWFSPHSGANSIWVNADVNHIIKLSMQSFFR